MKLGRHHPIHAKVDILKDTRLQTLPALLLLEKKPLREAAIFTATVNDNGTPEDYAAGHYAPYYDKLAKATQQHIAPENNTYETPGLGLAPAPLSSRKP